MKQINKERSLRNEKRRIAREERDKRISARIERKKEKQELRRAATRTNESTTPIYFASEYRSSTKSRRIEEEAKRRTRREQQVKLATEMKKKYQPKQEQRPREPYEQLPQMNTSRMFSQQALAAFNAQALGININTPQATTDFIGKQLEALPQDIQHFCMPVIHPVTGEHISNYMKLKRDPVTAPTWERSFGKEFGSLAQGDDLTGEKGTNTVRVMTHEEIANIPRNKVVTYARIVADYQEHKDCWNWAQGWHEASPIDPAPWTSNLSS